MSNLVMNILKKVMLSVVVASMAFSAWALSLDDAKKQGLVGEMPNGYLGLVVNSSEAKSLVDSVNKKRKDIYMKLARKNKLTMQQVTALAGKKAINKTKSGHYIKNAAGQWVKK